MAKKENFDAELETKKKPSNLHHLTDTQKLSLSDLPYIDLTPEGMEKLKSGGIKFSDLDKYLLRPDEKSSGDILPGERFKDANADIMGTVVDTDLDICKRIEEKGLGDLILTDITMDPESGFCAITFQDSQGNTGISFRGSDFDYANGGLNDWLKADVLEHFVGTSEQAKQASEYFATHCNPDGNNFMYGYSLGGNLVQHAFRDNHELVTEAFSINGNPITSSLLDSPEIIAAFNSDKFNCCIIAGDLIGMSKDNSLYRNNIRVIENSNGITADIMTSHGLGSVSLGDDGMFKTMPYQDMIKTVKDVLSKETIIDFNGFKVDGWEAFAMVQSMDNWATEKSEQIPEPIKDLITTNVFQLGKVPIGLPDFTALISHGVGKLEDVAKDVAEWGTDHKPFLNNMSFFNVPVTFFDWAGQTAEKIFAPAQNLFDAAGSFTLGTIGDMILLPTQATNRLEELGQDIKGFDYKSWAADLAEKFNIAPIFSDGSKVKNDLDLKEWGKEVQESLEEKTPDWIRNGIENSWLGKVIDKVKEIDISDMFGGKEEPEEQKKINIDEICDPIINAVENYAQSIINQAVQRTEEIVGPSSDEHAISRD